MPKIKSRFVHKVTRYMKLTPNWQLITPDATGRVKAGIWWHARTTIRDTIGRYLVSMESLVVDRGGAKLVIGRAKLYSM
jgi:hypothetical protein